LSVCLLAAFTRRPLVDQGLLIVEAPTITLRHTTLNRTPLDEWSAETPTWQRTILTRQRYPCHRRDSNPQSQQENSRRRTP